jgi:hypothetical protein
MHKEKEPMKPQNVEKALNTFFTKLRSLRDEVPSTLEAEYETIVEQTGTLRDDIITFLENWETEEANDDADDFGPDEDLEDEDDEDVDDDETENSKGLDDAEDDVAF